MDAAGERTEGRRVSVQTVIRRVAGHHSHVAARDNRIFDREAETPVRFGEVAGRVMQV
ncbi:hypothetical protein D3C72_2590410 [compost metagenome]